MNHRRRRRRGLSFGSIFMLLMVAGVLFGLYYFLTTVAGDSPAAAMNINQIVDAVENALQAPATATPTALPAPTATVVP